jgi:DNA-binding transcriptional regulator GbsR (MarR family)
MMNDQEQAFIEQAAQQLYEQGLPRMAGRVWGYLLICEPPQQTAAELATALQASRSSISGTVKLLEAGGLVQRSTTPGDRRERFSIPSDFAHQILRRRMAFISSWVTLADLGLEAIADRAPESSERLRDLRSMWEFMEGEIPALIERYLEREAGKREGAA